jgi:glutathionyl-hydroquinone reductase
VVHWFKGVPGLFPFLLPRSIYQHLCADEKGVYPGWKFATPEEISTEAPGSTEDHLYGARYLSELYFKAEPRYGGKYSVPVLWDKKSETIVNNESDQIMRMLSTAFDEYVISCVHNLLGYFWTVLNWQGSY